MALYAVDPWGPGRDDMRAAVGAMWNRGHKFDEIQPLYPYLKTDEQEASEDEDILAEIELAKEYERRHVERLIKEQATHATT